MLRGTTVHPLRALRQRERLSLKRLGNRARLAPRTILRAEQGHALNPSSVRLLCEYFGRSADELGLVIRSSGGPSSRDAHVLPSEYDVEMNRRELLSLSVAGGALVQQPSRNVPWPGFDGVSEALSRVGGGSAPQLLAEATRSYRLLEATTPSRHLIPPVQAHLDLARRHVNHPRDEDPFGSRSGYATVSEIAGLAAWLYADLGDLRAAREHYRLAIQFAERSGHQLLVPYMTASLGHFAAECGDTQQALTLVARARHQLPAEAPAAAKAWLAAIEAVAHASAQDRRGALVALDAAEHFASPGRSAAGPTWPWVFIFDSAKVSAYRASCAARFGDVGVAERAFAAARPALRSPKQYALALVDLAQAYGRRELGEACRLATEALITTRALDSERVARKVARFRTSLGSLTSPETAELDQRLAAAYL